MSFVLSQVLTRTVTVGVALALGLAGAVIPPPAPAEAQALPDLTFPFGSTSITAHEGETVPIVHVVKNAGSGHARAGLLWRLSLPTGFQIAFVQQTGWPGWRCSRNPSSVSCVNESPMPPGEATRLRVDVTAPRAPGTYQAVSVVDVNQSQVETNENNNRFVTTITVVP